MGKVEIHVTISYDMILKLLLLKYVHPMRGKHPPNPIAILHKTKGKQWILYRNIHMKYR